MRIKRRRNGRRRLKKQKKVCKRGEKIHKKEGTEEAENNTKIKKLIN
jgi:hypothetical protein